MLAIKIVDIKNFMNQLLIGETFDLFQTPEVSITTFNTFSIDGKIRRDFLDSDECDVLDQKHIAYSFWKDIKPFCYSIIRGKKTPLHFKIIFQLSAGQAAHGFSHDENEVFVQNVSGCFLNIQYKNRELLCTTGVSLKTFSTSKTFEQFWDSLILDFFRKKNILFEKL